MNSSPLQALHQQFSAALQEKGAYIATHPTETGRLVKTKQKNIRLQEVFRMAQAQVRTILNKATNEAKMKEIVYMRALQKDGTTFYERYEKSTMSWKRSFFKGLAHFTPEFLKRFLPRCFSNGMAAAEKATQQNHQEFQALLNQEIKSTLSIPLDAIQVSWNQLNQYEEKPLSLQMYQATLAILAQTIVQVIKSDPENGKHLIEERGISKEVIDALSKPNLLKAFESKDSQSLTELLKSSPFEASFQEALAQKGIIIKFGIRNL